MIEGRCHSLFRQSAPAGLAAADAGRLPRAANDGGLAFPVMKRRYGSALIYRRSGRGDSAGAIGDFAGAARTLVAANISSAKCAGVPEDT